MQAGGTPVLHRNEGPHVTLIQENFIMGNIHEKTSGSHNGTQHHLISTGKDQAESMCEQDNSDRGVRTGYGGLTRSGASEVNRAVTNCCEVENNAGSVECVDVCKVVNDTGSLVSSKEVDNNNDCDVKMQINEMTERLVEEVRDRLCGMSENSDFNFKSPLNVVTVDQNINIEHFVEVTKSIIETNDRSVCGNNDIGGNVLFRTEEVPDEVNALLKISDDSALENMPTSNNLLTSETHYANLNRNFMYHTVQNIPFYEAVPSSEQVFESDDSDDACERSICNSELPRLEGYPDQFGQADLMDEDSLNPSSLPFESLNSSFQYAVLIDSCSEDDEIEGDSSSLTNPSDGELSAAAKLRLAFGSSGGGDSLDYLSTEAEKQLECCDLWSLGSCSFGGSDCRTLEKRRQSAGCIQDEDGRFTAAASKELGNLEESNINQDKCDGFTPKMNTKDDEDSKLIGDALTTLNTPLVNENTNINNEGSCKIFAVCAESAISAVSNTECIEDDSPRLVQEQQPCSSAATESVASVSFAPSAEQQHTVPSEPLVVDPESRSGDISKCGRAGEERQPQAAGERYDGDSGAGNATAESHCLAEPGEEAASLTAAVGGGDVGDDSIPSWPPSDRTDAVQLNIDTHHENSAPHALTLDSDGGLSVPSSGEDTVPAAAAAASLPSTPTKATSPSSEQFRRSASFQLCTVLLPPSIDEEPDILEEGFSLCASEAPSDSRSSHSSGNSGRTVRSSDGASEVNHGNGNATYEAVLTATQLHSSNNHTKNSGCVADISGGKGLCEFDHSAKPELKSYLGKSMLPGLSGLHGLSSLRQSPSNILKPSHSKNTPENPRENNMSHSSRSASGQSGVSNGSTGEEIAWVSRRLQAHRQLSSSDSWGSEDFESYSSNEEDGGITKNEATDKGIETSVNSSKISTDSVGSSGSIAASSAGREKLKARLLRKREQWKERRQSSSKEFKQQQLLLRKDSKEVSRDAGDCGKGGVLCGSIEDVHGVPGGADAGKLSRWFSLRKSVNYDLDRKGGPSNNSTAASNPGHPVGGAFVSASSSKGAAAATHEDGGPSNLPNSSTLSSISSYSSNSSTSTNSSSSSTFVPPHQHHHGAQHNPSLRLPQLLELEERMSELEASTNPSKFYHTCGGLSSLGTNTFQRRHQPPSLPPIPTGLSPDQIKRRHIVASIVHSENNYVATLHRLVREYRKPLEESKPPILNQSKVSILFHYVHEILQCHTLFRIALTDCVRHWDRDEKIGDVFFASFSKGVVLDIYSEFINNFTRAMELAKMESRKKSAFADFLKMRQITSPDRLSFFGMMVKPVQRFPQFILFLQDLLKYTPKGHPDRMSLQLALTQLESLAETLNEQKRESEQHQAFKATLKQINSKFALRSICEGNRCLIRQDDVTKLEFGPNGLIKQTKERRLFLTTDAVICVSVVPRGSADEFGGGGGTNERLSLKWVHPVTEIEVQENNSSLTLSRLLAAGLSQRPSSGTITSVSSTCKQGTGATTAPSGGAASVYDIYSSPALRVGGPGGVGVGTSLEESETMVRTICVEMNELMHDYQVVSRIAGLADTLKGSYDPLTASSLQGVLSTIQEAIQARDDRMSWLDGCCLQVRAGKELITFHVQHPDVKKDWIIELRMAQLAVSSVNSPAWDSGYLHQGGDGSHQRPPSRRPPLFVTALPLLHAAHHTQVVCGCQYPLVEYPKIPSLRGGGGLRPRGGKNVTSVWVCSTDGVTSHLTRYVTHHGALREVTRVRLAEVCVTGMLHVPPPHCSPLSSHTSSAAHPSPLTLDTVWIGTLQNRLLLYSGSTPDSQQEISNTELPAAVSALIYHCEQVFIGLTDGTLLAYCRSPDDLCWQLAEPVSMKLSDNAPIKALLPLSAQLYAAVADTVLVLDCSTLMLMKQLSVHHGGSVSLLAHSGIGLWVCEEGAPSTVCLYHTESCRHLQDIDLAPSVARVLGVPPASCSVVVTGLVVSRGLLWVGTSVGVTLTFPLPRLQGVPIISGRPTLSYHAHAGPVTFLMTLMPPEYYILPSKGVTSPDNKGVHAPASEVRVDEDRSDKGRQRASVDGNGDNISDAAGSNNNNNNRTECDISNTGSGIKNSQVSFGVNSGSDLRREALRKASTLPRGFGSGGAVRSALMGIANDVPGTMGVSTTSSSDEGAVMGVCGELLRHWGDDHAVVGCGDREAANVLRRSDPSLSGVTSSTLDRRLRLRAGRPRSLDLSSMSIDSKVSAATASSGGSEECYGVNLGLLQCRQSTIHEDSHDSVSEKGQSRRNSSTQETEGERQQQGSDDKVALEQANSNIKHEQDTENVSCEKIMSEVPTNSEDSAELICQISTDPIDSEITAQPDSTISGEVEDNDSLDKKTIRSENLKISEESGDCKHSNESRSSPSSSSRKSLSSDSGASRHSLKLLSRHRRSSSDVTQKSLSSSTSNVSSLYYEGDLETSDAAGKTNSASDPKRTERNGESECTQTPVKPEEPQRSSELANLSRKPSVTSTTNKKNAGTLSRSPTTKSSSNNGKGDAGKKGCRDMADQQPRTVLVLTGGQGYKCIREDTPTNGPPHNNTDAHLLVWEMKL